jgi:hypothetical protein
MYNTDIQYIIGEIHSKSTSDMHNLKTNFDKFFNITKSVFKVATGFPLFPHL